jgi:hypothetical protein
LQNYLDQNKGNNDNKSLSAVVHGRFTPAADIIKLYTNGAEYNSTVSDKHNAVGPQASSILPPEEYKFKRARVTLGTIAQNLVQLPALTQKLAERNQFNDVSMQPYSRHLNADTPAAYGWIHSYEAQKQRMRDNERE